MMANRRRDDERIKMVKAMEYIARQINDEEVFDVWLSLGVADQDIEYGDLTDDHGNGLIDWYIEDNEFSYIMRMFMKVMHLAYKSGGLWCNGISSQEGNRAKACK